MGVDTEEDLAAIDGKQQEQDRMASGVTADATGGGTMPPLVMRKMKRWLKAGRWSKLESARMEGRANALSLLSTCSLTAFRAAKILADSWPCNG